MSENISIIIPVYNDEKYLEQCLDSVLNQTYADFNLVLVDDNSSDNSLNICKEYEKNDSRIKVIYSTENRGVSFSREAGFNNCDSDWIMFLDHDDIVAPNLLESLIKHENEAELICTHAENADDEMINVTDWTAEISSEAVCVAGNEACRLVYKRNANLGFVSPLWGKLIRRELLEKVLTHTKAYERELDWGYLEDVLASVYLFNEAGHVYFDNNYCYKHRVVGTSLGAQLKPGKFGYQAAKASDIVVNYLKDNGQKEGYENLIFHEFLNAQSVWYKSWNYEKNQQLKHDFDSYMTSLYLNKYGQLRDIKINDKGQMVQFLCIWLFKVNRNLWNKTIGYLWFEKLQKGKHK